MLSQSRCFFWALFILLFSPAIATAATTGTIEGVVTDRTHALISNASVALTSIETNSHQTLQTDGNGGYRFLALPVGHYSLEVKAPGFRTYIQKEIAVNANDALRIDVALDVGDVKSQVEVSAAAIHVEQESSSVGDVVAEKTIESLPLNGRSFVDLLSLQSNVVPRDSGILAFSGGTFGGCAANGNVSIAGQREVYNAFEVNGGSVNETRNNGTTVIPNIDAIDEFRVIVNNADASDGGQSGAFVEVTTKSGSNTLHGSAFEFVRNDVFDATGYFTVKPAELRRNQVGGTLGGPIKRDKLFYFIDYQGTWQTQEASPGEVQVLSSKERTGDFSQSPSQLLSGTVGGPYFANLLSQRLGYAVSSGEPYFTPGCTVLQCVFPNQVIPQAAFSPAAKGLLSFLPQANITTEQGSYFSGLSNDVNHDQLAGARIDAKTKIGSPFAYYYVDFPSNVNAYGDDSGPGIPTGDNGHTHFINLGDSTIFNAHTVNELRFVLTRYVSNADQPQQGLGTNLSALGFNVEVPGGLYPADPAKAGVPTVDIFGGATIGQPLLVYSRYETIPQVRDNLSLTSGKHLFKFGGQYQYTNFIQFFPSAAGNGAYFFTGAETGNNYTDFLLGAPTFFAEESQLNPWERSHAAALYAQDTWRIGSHLVLNLGLRWNLIEPFYERSNQKATYLAGAQSKVFPTAPAGEIFPGDPIPGGGTVPRTIAKTPKDNFAPVVGFAYALSGSSGVGRALFGESGQTSLRASFGIYYMAADGAQTFFTDPAVPYLVNYTSPLPSLLESPLTDRSDGVIHSLPLPFTPPKPGQLVDFSPFIPLSGYPVVALGNTTPYTEAYQLDAERQFGRSAVMYLGYLGNQGHHLPASLGANPGNPALCLSLPGCGPFGENGVYGTVNSTRGPLGANFGDDYYMTTIANSAYNSLRAAIRVVANPRLNLTASYTLSKSIDNSSSAYNDLTLDPYNHRASRALSVFDCPHTLVAQFDYLTHLDLIGSGHLRGITGGWHLTGIGTFASGLPVTITEGDDRSLLGLFGTGIGGGNVDVPDFTRGSLNLSDPRSTTKPYFNTGLFTPEPLGQLGDSPRRFFQGPGMNNFDLGVRKEIKIRESMTLQLRSEWFNAFNHAQFNNPDGNITDGPGAFGLVTSARAPRIGQFAIKLNF